VEVEDIVFDVVVDDDIDVDANPVGCLSLSLSSSPSPFYEAFFEISPFEAFLGLNYN